MNSSHEVASDGETARLVCETRSDGDVVVALDTQRINNDVAEAVSSDFDKMAAREPTEAIWITLSRSVGHRVIDALRDPIDGKLRVEREYSEQSPLHRRQYDTPGLTQVYTTVYVRDRLLC